MRHVPVADAARNNDASNADTQYGGKTGNFMLKHEKGLREFINGVVSAPVLRTGFAKVFDHIRSKREEGK